MTGYTVHTGSTGKFSTGWDQIFSKRKPLAKKHAAALTEEAGRHPKKQVVRKRPTSKKKLSSASPGKKGRKKSGSRKGK
jgi:hypothetical protein